MPVMDSVRDEPSALRAGDAVTWQRDLDAYSAVAGWTLKYRLIWPTGTPATFDATGAGTTHTVELASADTSAWPAGAATLLAYVDNGTDTVTLEALPVTILPNLVTATTFDGRSAARIGLDNARAALNTYLASGRAHVAEYQIAGRVMKFRSADEIRALIEYYEAEVARENAALAILQGGSPGRVITLM